MECGNAAIIANIAIVYPLRLAISPSLRGAARGLSPIPAPCYTSILGPQRPPGHAGALERGRRDYAKPGRSARWAYSQITYRLLSVAPPQLRRSPGNAIAAARNIKLDRYRTPRGQSLFYTDINTVVREMTYSSIPHWVGGRA